MNLLLTTLGQLLLATVAVAVPAGIGFCLGLRVVDDRGRRWREHALRMEAERDGLSAALQAIAPSPARPAPVRHRALRVVRTAGGDR